MAWLFKCKNEACTIIIEVITFALLNICWTKGLYIKSAYEPSGSLGRSYPGFTTMTLLAVYLLPPTSWMGCYSISGVPLALNSPVRTVRVKALAQEHNTMFPARAQARNACSGVEQVNHEATALKAKTLQAWSMDVYSFFSRSSTDWDVLEESKVDCSFLLVDANWGWLLAPSYSR